MPINSSFLLLELLSFRNVVHNANDPHSPSILVALNRSPIAVHPAYLLVVNSYDPEFGFKNAVVFFRLRQFLPDVLPVIVMYELQKYDTVFMVLSGVSPSIR